MEIKPLDPLVHFIFIYYKAVSPMYFSKRVTPHDLEKLKSLKGRERIHFACELTDFLRMEEYIVHLDWMVSDLSWSYK